MNRTVFLVLAGLAIATTGDPVPAQEADVTVDGPDASLAPNTTGQSFQLGVAGDEPVAGLDLAVQVGDGESESDPEPAITGIDLESETIFADNNTGQTNNGSTPHRKFFSITTESGTVAASGKLASLTVDTSGIESGRFRLAFEDVLGADSRFLAPDASIVPADFSAGSIAIGPSPEVVWTGSGDDSKTSTGLNWNGLAAPLAGDTLVFAGSNDLDVANDLPAGRSFAELRFASDAGSFALAGNAFGLADGGTIINASESVQTVEAGVTAVGALSVAGPGDTRLAGEVSGPGSLTKRGPGRLELLAENTYAGETRVEEGTAIIAGSVAGSARVTGGRLAGDGRIEGDVVADGGELAPGSSIGELEVAGDATVTGSGVLSFELAPDEPTDSDLLTVAGSATLESGSTVSVSKAGVGELRKGDRFTVLSASGGLTDAGAGVISQVEGIDFALDAGSTALELIAEEPTLLTVDPGDRSLSGDAAGQTITLAVNGGEPVAGLDLALQVGDGEAAQDPEPAITGIDLESGTIFADNNTGQTDNGSSPQQKFFSITTESGTVEAAGRLATLTVDTSGIETGRFRLAFEDVLGADSAFLASDASLVTTDFTAGSIGVGPSPEVVWTGAGDDSETATGRNWNGLARPLAGDTVIFAGDEGLDVFNDLPAGRPFAELRFASDAGSFMLSGNALGIADGGAIANRSAQAQTIDTAVIAAGSLAVTGAGDTRIAGAVTGPGSLTKRGTGRLELVAENAFSGETAIEAGTLAVDGGAAIPDSSAVSIADADNARLALLADETIGGLAGGAAGSVALNANRLTVSGGSDAPFAGSIRGSGGVTKTGDGALTLSGENTFEGDTSVENGVLRLTGSVAGSVSLGDGARLAGDGSAGGDLAAGNGEVAPGTSIGTLDVGGSFSLGSDGLLDLEIAPGADQPADLLSVAESATLADGGTVRVSRIGDESIGNGDTFTLLTASGGLTENGVELDSRLGGVDVSLQAGTNDLRLVASVVETIDWIGEGDAAKFSDAANWSTEDGVSPDVGGSTLRFTGTGATLDADQGDYTAVGGLTFASEGSGGFTLQGGELAFVDGGAAIVNERSAEQTVDNDLVAGDAGLRIEAAEGPLTLTGALELGSSDGLIVRGSSRTTLDGPVSGEAGLTKRGTGRLDLLGANTFTGETRIEAGTLAVGGGAAIADDARVSIADESTAELTLQDDETIGALAGGGAVTLGENRLTVAGSGSSTFAGSIAGSGGLTKSGSGRLELAGSNTFSGETRVAGGTLALAGGSAIADGAAVTLDDASGVSLSLLADETIGPLTGGGQVSLNDNRLGVGVDGDATFAGVIAGSGGITKSGPGTWTLTNDHTFTGITRVAGGLLRLNGSVSGPARVAGGALGGAGRVGGGLTVESGDLRPGNSIGALAVGGDLALQSDGALAAELRPAALDDPEALAADLVRVDGDASLAEGSTIRVAPTGEGELEREDSFTLIDTQGGTIDDAGAALVSPARAELVPEIADGLFRVRVTSVARFRDIVEDRGIGRALDRLVESADRGNPRAQELTETLRGLSDDEVNRFADQVKEGGRNADITTEVAVDQSQTFTANQSSYLSARRAGTPGLASVQGSELASVDAPLGGGPLLATAAQDPRMLAAAVEQTTQPRSLPPASRRDEGLDIGGFVKPYGVFANQDPTSSATGYRSDGYGFQVGLDAELVNDWLIGFAYGYSDTDATLDRGLGSFDIASYRVGPYASYSSGGWFLDLSATYALHDHTSTRSTLAGSAEGSFDADEFTFFERLGYRFEVGGDGRLSGLEIIPTASMRYTHYSRDAYSESGDAPLDFESFDSDRLYTRLGARVRKPFDVGTMTWVPEAEVAWEHEFLQETEVVEATFPGGGSFGLDTASPESDGLVLGAGLSVLFNRDVSTFLRYEGTLSDRGAVHAVNMGLNVRF